jgi:PII-like signaling protein
MKKQNWVKKGHMFVLDSATENVPLLPNYVFLLKYNPNIGIYLEKAMDRFEFNYKVYGVENEFINRVLKSYEHSTSNLGVLLNGVKGTGKTVTAEILAASVDLPVIIINTDYKELLVDFLSGINQEVVLFFDEYEKIFERSTHMLTVMDGVMSNAACKKLILLTTNRTYIDDNLLQRPGRIRYVKNFAGLKKETIKEIADDLLVNKMYFEDLISTLNNVEIVTIDVVKSLINEINLHDAPASVLVKDFNVQAKTPEEYRMYIVDGGNSTYLYTLDTRFSHFGLEVEDTLYYPGAGDIGEVIEVKGDDFIVKLFKNRPYTGSSYFDKHLDLGDTSKDEPRKGRNYRQKEDTDAIMIHMRADVVKQIKYLTNLVF